MPNAGLRPNRVFNLNTSMAFPLPLLPSPLPLAGNLPPLPPGWMLVCDEYALHKDLKTGLRYYKWVTRKAVIYIKDGSLIRCSECHGPVEIRRKRDPNGPPDHVEHPAHDPSVVHCRKGHRFCGFHRMSYERIF